MQMQQTRRAFLHVRSRSPGAPEYEPLLWNSGTADTGHETDQGQGGNVSIEAGLQRHLR